MACSYDLITPTNRQYFDLKTFFLLQFESNANSYMTELPNILGCEVFKTAINSPRDLDNVHTIRDLVVILEKRNAIHESDVSMLIKICFVVNLKSKFSSIPSWLRNIEKTLKDYKETTKNCLLCYKDYKTSHRVTKVTQMELPISTSQSNQVTSSLQCNISMEPADSKDTAEISGKPQLWWEQVCRFCDWEMIRKLPGIKEKTINSIRKKNGNLEIPSLRECFFYWVREGGHHVNPENVYKAIRSSGHSETVILA